MTRVFEEAGVPAGVLNTVTENINSAFYVADKLEVRTVQVNNKAERDLDN